MACCGVLSCGGLLSGGVGVLLAGAVVGCWSGWLFSVARIPVAGCRLCGCVVGEVLWCSVAFVRWWL